MVMSDWLELLKYALRTFEAHFHTRIRWLGARAGWDGTNEVASASNDSIDPFVLTSGNDTWGTPLCIIGSGDTPVIPGNIKFDPHRVSIQATSDDAPMRMRLAWGVSYAVAIAAEDFTEVSLVSRDWKVSEGPFDILCPRLDSGTKLFGALWARDVDAETASFTLGIHEYEE